MYKSSAHSSSRITTASMPTIIILQTRCPSCDPINGVKELQAQVFHYLTFSNPKVSTAWPIEHKLDCLNDIPTTPAAQARYASKLLLTHDLLKTKPWSHWQLLLPLIPLLLFTLARCKYVQVLQPAAKMIWEYQRPGIGSATYDQLPGTPHQ